MGHFGGPYLLWFLVVVVVLVLRSSYQGCRHRVVGTCDLLAYEMMVYMSHGLHSVYVALNEEPDDQSAYNEF